MKQSTTNTILVVAALAALGVGGYFVVKKMGEGKAADSGGTKQVTDTAKPKGDDGILGTGVSVSDVRDVIGLFAL